MRSRVTYSSFQAPVQKVLDVVASCNNSPYITNLLFFLYGRKMLETIDQSEFEGFEYINPLLMSSEECV